MMASSTEQKKILIVDDEEHIVKMLEMNMRTHGYSGISALNGEDGYDLAVSESPDLILLDVMLPGIDGIEVCRRLKNNPETRKIPVIMLSAKSQGQDKIDGLLGGADDYITKPFSFEELFLRIRASLRQVELLSAESSRIFGCGSLTMDTEKYLVSSGGSKIDLTLTEFRILALLLKNEGGIVSRDTLIREIFGRDPSDEGRTVDVHIRNLRRKMEAAGVSGCSIETVRGSGYRI
jgi:two-component system, OmpR family, alkaline phosphatase synthesis response regulator PhoP